MIGYMVIAAVGGFAGWIYGRMQSRRIEDDLRFELSCWEGRCRALKRRLAAKEVS